MCLASAATQLREHLSPFHCISYPLSGLSTATNNENSPQAVGLLPSRKKVLSEGMFYIGFLVSTDSGIGLLSGLTWNKG